MEHLSRIAGCSGRSGWAAAVSVCSWRRLALGFAGFAPDPHPDWGVLLDNFHVDPDRKGLGIGRALFAAGAGDMLSRDAGAGIHLFVYAANAAACRVYDRLGGNVVERLDDPPGGLPGQAELRYHWPAAALRAIIG